MCFTCRKYKGIEDIFEKDNYGNYTKDALLLQDILCYPLKNIEDGIYNFVFKDRDLASWLIDNNNEFINYYKDLSTRNITKSNRIENRLPRIKGNVQDLIKLGLIEKIGTTRAEKVDAQVTVYRYTQPGVFIGWIIMSMNPEKKAKAEEEIYKILRIWNNGIGSSYSLFKLILLRKAKEKGTFGVHVDCLRSILHSGKSIKSMRDLFSDSAFEKIPEFDQLMDKASKNPFAISRSTIEALDEMPQEKREMFLYTMKQDIENEMMDITHNREEYEKMRFKYRDDFSVVVLMAYCFRCKYSFSDAIDLLFYLQTKFAPNLGVGSDCPQCKTKSSVIFTPV